MTKVEHLQYWMVASAATAIFGLFSLGILS
jgi:hypothetical protein